MKTTLIRPFKRPMSARTIGVLADYQNPDLAVKNIADKWGLSMSGVCLIGHRNGYCRHRPRKSSLNKQTT
jgi:hypothetical protein